MIYTVTLNPSVDYTVFLPEYTEGRTNRAYNEFYNIGGKGLNVSRVLAQFSIKSTAVAFIAGFTGELIQNNMNNSMVIKDFIWLDNGFSRINVKIKSHTESEINGSGPDISEKASEKLFEKLGLLKNGDTLILAGSIPKSLPDNYYTHIIKRVCNKDIRVVVDAEKQVLTDTLKFRPYLIKPNKQELEEIFEVKISDIDTAVNLAFKLKQMGAENVLVSLGEQGAVLIDLYGRIHRCEAIRGKTVCTTVGAGDSMIAGFIHGVDKYGEYDKALKMGVACGCASVFSQGLAEKNRIFELFDVIMNR